MTLVVARKWRSGRVRVIADLRVTDSNDIRRGYPFAALKNVILSRDLLIAYAGNASLAMHTLRELASSARDPDQVLTTLSESSLRADGGDDGVDYILAAPGRGLWRITHVGVKAVQEATWIGDRDAFELYQRAFHEMPVSEPIRIPGVSPEGPLQVDPKELEDSIRMMNAISSFQFGPSVESVGEAFIEATWSAEGFRYEQQAHLAADHEQVITGDEWVSADWGTVAEGGFGYSTLIPTEPGIGLLGLYFPHAELGLLYHPLNRDDAFVYARVTHESFRGRVLAEHGVRIDGPTFGSSGRTSPETD
jgi:hypothetical protein